MPARGASAGAGANCCRRNRNRRAVRRRCFDTNDDWVWGLHRFLPGPGWNDGLAGYPRSLAQQQNGTTGWKATGTTERRTCNRCALMYQARTLRRRFRERGRYAGRRRHDRLQPANPARQVVCGEGFFGRITYRLDVTEAGMTTQKNSCRLTQKSAAPAASDGLPG